MKMNRGLIGWAVAAVLALALGGVLVYGAADDDAGGRTAALGSQGKGQGPPADVAADVNQILADKEKQGKDRLPPIPPGQQATRVEGNPEHRCDPTLEPNVMAVWRNAPENLGQARGLADQIVVGVVEGVRDADPLTAEAQNEPGGVVTTPVQQITIRVEDSVKGRAKKGEVVTIERLGDSRGCFRVQGDPAYEQGSRHLLMLENGRGGRAPHVIAPEGRYKVREGGALEAVTKNPVAEEVASERLEQVLAKLR